ncbi:MAG: hypothetical protein AAF962_06065 [Actinomycetota bacterium]
MSSSLSRSLVIVAYHDQRPVEPVLRLFDSMDRHDPGLAHDRVVVVNTTDGARVAELRSAGITCVEKPDRGMNLGAWDHGWRTSPRHDAFLFLQDDCTVVRRGWLRAFADACGPGVGLVGESFNENWNAPWNELRESRGHIPIGEHVLDGKPANRIDVYLDFMRRSGIDPGAGGDHLRGQVWYAHRTALEDIDGFPYPTNRGEWIGAEIAVSRSMVARGWELVQVDESPFHYIAHHEWQVEPGTGVYTHADSVGRLGRARRRLVGPQPATPDREPADTESVGGRSVDDESVDDGGVAEVRRSTSGLDGEAPRRRAPRSDRRR